MARVVSATKARMHFGEMMQQVVSEQEPIIVQRAGKPQIVLLSIGQYERLIAAQQSQTDWRDKVRQARAQIAAELGEQDLPPAETIIRQMREERDAQLVDLR